MIDVSTPDVRPSRAGRRRGVRGAPGDHDTAGDLRLVRRLLDRDTAAWGKFFQRYERLIYNRVRAAFAELGRVTNQDVVEDCCAGVLAELFQDDLKTLRTYQGKAKLSTWLAVITRRVTIRTLTAMRGSSERQPGSDCDLEQIAAPSGRSSLSGELDCREIVLQHCLRQLSKPDRLVLELHFEQGLSYGQIGRQLGITANAVGPKLSRAQKRLKILVAKYRPPDSRRKEPN